MQKKLGQNLTLILFLICGIFSLTAQANQNPPRLLSYKQLMQLSTLKRGAYIQSVADLLVKLEAQGLAREDKMASLEEIQELKAEFFAMMSLLPEAQAEQSGDAPAVPVVKKKKEFNAKIIGDQEILNGDSPVGAVAPRKGGPSDELAPPNSSPIVKPRLSPRGVRTPGTAPELPQPGEAIAPEATETCEVVQPTACSFSKKDEDKARKNLRASGKAACIFAGNFSTYEGGVAKKGRCKKVTQFKVKGFKKPACANGTYPCNPYLFCTQYKDAGRANKVPEPMCLPLVDKKTKRADITARCNGAYNNAEFLEARGLKQCEPGKGPIPDLDAAWEEMRAKIEGHFSEVCMGDENYKVLFCNECSVLGTISAMNKAATGSSCGGPKPVEVEAAAPLVDPLNGDEGARR